MCEEVTIMVANKGEGVMVKEDLVTHRSIKEDLAFPAYQRPQLQTYQPVGSVSLAFFAHFVVSVAGIRVKIVRETVVLTT